MRYILRGIFGYVLIYFSCTIVFLFDANFECIRNPWLITQSFPGNSFQGEGLLVYSIYYGHKMWYISIWVSINTNNRAHPKCCSTILSCAPPFIAERVNSAVFQRIWSFLWLIDRFWSGYDHLPARRLVVDIYPPPVHEENTMHERKGQSH